MRRDEYPVSDSVAIISPGNYEIGIPMRPITCNITSRADILANEGGSITACRPIVYVQLLIEANAK